MFVPAPLFPGARVALVGPSSAVSEERLRRADSFVSALGLKPVYYPLLPLQKPRRLPRRHGRAAGAGHHARL